MAGIGIFVGLIVFLFTGAFLGDCVFHNSGASTFPAMVIGIWAAWPFFHHSSIHRYNLMHPVPNEYKVPAKHAFSKIRELLAEIVYNYGDKWQVVTADTQTGRIVADLRFTDEHTDFDIDGSGHVHTRKERLQRFIGLEVLVNDTGKGTAIVQLDFVPRVEGLYFTACDSIATGISQIIEMALGRGTPIGNPVDSKLPAPPWWLVGISVFALLGICCDVMKAVFK